MSIQYHMGEMMKANMRRYFRAVGSLLDLFPATDYSKIINSSMSDSEAMTRDLEMIGDDFRKAIAGFNAEQAAKSEE